MVYVALTRRTTGGRILRANFERPHSGHLNVPSISSHLLFGERCPHETHSYITSSDIAFPPFLTFFLGLGMRLVGAGRRLGSCFRIV